MTAKWEKKGTNDGVLTFEISEEKIKEGLDTAFNKVKSTLSVPGFRKGKFLVQSSTNNMVKKLYTKML